MVLKKLAAPALVVTILLAVTHGGQAATTGYTVKRGDTLSAIARQLRVDPTALAAANGIADIHKIVAGARLRMPTAANVPQRAAGGRLPERLRREPARLALMQHFDAAARDYNVPADLVKAVAWQESGWQNDKLSSADALGVGQLRPATVDFVNQVLLRAALDPKKPEHNIRLSARYLAWLLQAARGDTPTAVAGYYQGMASVQRIGPLPETKRYVANVLALRAQFS
jgi:soluble lytic murein transglycosylase-like protein